MATNFEIRIKGALDEKSTSRTIKKQLQQIEKDVQLSFKFDSKSVKQLNTSLKESSTQTAKLKTEVASTSKNVNILGNNFFEAGKKFASWFVLGNIISSIFKGITGMVSAVFELDSALIEFNKVASLSNQELDNFTDASFNVANEFGRSVDVAISGAAAFKRAGFEVAESATLASEALLLMNVGNIELETSTKSLIAIMKSYGFAADESRAITDKLNEVANTTSISVEDLTNGLRRTSALFAQTGTDVNQLIGLLVGTNDELQNIQKTSSGLVTIASRLQRMADGTDELSELVPKLEEEFQQMNLTLLDQDGQLKSVFDILSDLSTVYGDLDKNTKAHINFLISGTRQSVVLASAMNDWDSVMKAVNSSINSQGSAMRENAIFMESLEGRVNVLSSELTRLGNDVIDKDLVKSLISLATFIVKMTDELAKTGLLLPGIITSFVLLNANMKAFAVGAVTKGVVALVSSLTGLQIKAVATTGAMTALTGAITFGLAIAIPLLIKGIDSLANAYANNIRALDDLIQKSESDIANNEKRIKSLKELSDEYNELASQEFRTNEEQDRLVSIQDELLDQYPELNKYIDSQGMLRGLNAKAIQEETERITEQQRLLQQGILFNELQKINEAIAQIGRAEAVSNIARLFSGMAMPSLDIDVGRTLQPQIENLLQSVIEFESAFGDLGDFAKSAGTVLKDDFVDRFIELNGEIDESNLPRLKSEFEGLLSTLSDPSLVDSIAEYDKLFNTISKDGKVTDEELKTLQDSFINLNDELSNATDGLITAENTVVRLPSDISNLATSVDDLTTDFDELNKSIGDYADKATKLGSIVTQLNDGQKLTVQQISELRKTFPELNDLLGTNNDLNLQSAETYERLFRLIQDEKEATLQAELDKQNTFLATADAALIAAKARFGFGFDEDVAAILGIDLEAMKAAEANIAILKAEIDALGSETISSYQKQTSERKKQAKTLEDYFNILMQIEAQEDMISETSKIRAQLDEESATYARDAQASVTEQVAEMDTLITLLRQLNDERQKDLDILIASGKTDVETREQIRELSDDIRDTNLDIKDIELEQVDLQRNLNDELEKQSDTLKKSSEQREKEIDDIFEAIVDSYDESFEATKKFYEDLGKEAEKAIQKEIDARREALDELKEDRKEEQDRLKIIDAQTKLQEEQNNLLKARQVLQNTLDERTARRFTGTGFEYVADPRAVREAQENVDEAEKRTSEAREDLRRTEEEVAFNRLVRRREAEIDQLEKSKKAVAEKTEFTIQQLEREQEEFHAMIAAKTEDEINFDTLLNELSEAEKERYAERIIATAEWAQETISWANEVEAAYLALAAAQGAASSPSISDGNGNGSVSNTTNNTNNSTNFNIGNLNISSQSARDTTRLVGSVFNAANKRIGRT